FGFVAGAHVYPLRAGKITFGFGGHVLYGGGTKTLDLSTATTQSSSPTLKRHFKAYASEVSFNFGHRTGYSYISGGIGRTTLYVDREDSPATNVPTRQTFHYGAGARWFTNHHTAVTFDLRWYSVAEMLPGPTYVGQPRTTLLVLSGGVAFR
ncbi:MAG TPA: hypothetical protein VG871_22540, partial [Vicinamibacterales bacterium]|nr:hypothetical protein [Vicinamibacterales bacterium]